MLPYLSDALRVAVLLTPAALSVVAPAWVPVAVVPALLVLIHL